MPMDKHFGVTGDVNLNRNRALHPEHNIVVLKRDLVSELSKPGTLALDQCSGIFCPEKVHAIFTEHRNFI